MKNRKGEVITLLTIGALVVIGVTAVITSLTPTQNQKKTTSSRAAMACMDGEIKCGPATNNDCCDTSTEKCSAGKCVPLSPTDCGGPEYCSGNSNQYYKKSGANYSDRLCSPTKKIDDITTYCAPAVTECEGPKTCATSTNKYWKKSGAYYAAAGCTGTAMSLTAVCPPPTSTPKPDPTAPVVGTCTSGGQKFLGTNGYNVDTPGDICKANGGTYVGNNQQGNENGQRWACCKLTDTTLGFDGCCKAYRPEMYDCPGGNKVVIYARSMSAVGMTSCSKYNSSTNTSMYFACDPNKYVDGGCTSSIIWDGGMSVDDKNNQGNLVNATPTPEPQMGECEFVACGDDTEKGYYKRVRTGGSVGYYRDGDKCEADSGLLSEASIKRDICGGGTSGVECEKKYANCSSSYTVYQGADKFSYWKSKSCMGNGVAEDCYSISDSTNCTQSTWNEVANYYCKGTPIPGVSAPPEVSTAPVVPEVKPSPTPVFSLNTLGTTSCLDESGKYQQCTAGTPQIVETCKLNDSFSGTKSISIFCGNGWLTDKKKCYYKAFYLNGIGETAYPSLAEAKNVAACVIDKKANVQLTVTVTGNVNIKDAVVALSNVSINGGAWQEKQADTSGKATFTVDYSGFYYQVKAYVITENGEYLESAQKQFSTSDGRFSKAITIQLNK